MCLCVEVLANGSLGVVLLSGLDHILPSCAAQLLSHLRANSLPIEHLLDLYCVTDGFLCGVSKFSCFLNFLTRASTQQ